MNKNGFIGVNSCGKSVVGKCALLRKAHEKEKLFAKQLLQKGVGPKFKFHTKMNFLQL